jgi:hypothetical protein
VFSTLIYLILFVERAIMTVVGQQCFRLAIVTFWACAGSPEPLACWIEVTSDEYSGFQAGRVVIVGGGGLVLFLIMRHIDTVGGILEPLESGSTDPAYLPQAASA